jgi:UDP-N-acetylglucosamine 2-epimerase (non-hydrolysing)
MNKIRILTVLGTRPEAVKLAPVIREFKHNSIFESLVCVTAQHRELLDQVLQVFDISPDIDLNLMKPDQLLSALAAAILKNLDPVFERAQPDWVLVQGDTTTAMAASIAAYHWRIKIGHVEAGLRTHDKWQPFPEEVNRHIVSVVADLHFAPTELSKQNLLKENIDPDSIIVTGNTVIDALKWILMQPEPPSVNNLLSTLGAGHDRKGLVLVTAHRRENFGSPIENICNAIVKLAKLYFPRLQFLYPVHPNPHIHEPVYRILSGVPNVHLVQPLEYIDLVHILSNAMLVLTDSGGIQEEATGLGIPTLVLREVTERPEGVDAGVLELVGTDVAKIVASTQRLLEDKKSYDRMAHAANPYGDGQAAGRIIQSLLEHTPQS